MPFAISTNYSVAVNRETVWATPLTSGAKYLRITGANLASNIQTIQSNEINPLHRETADVIAVSAGGGGTVDAEMIYDVFEPCIESLFGAAFSGTTVRTFKMGKTLKSLTVQELYADITQFVSYPGSVVTSWNLNVQNGQIMTTQFGFASKKGVSAAVTAIGTVGAANTNAVMSPLAHVQLLTEGGSAVAGVASLSLQVANDLITIPSLLLQDPAALYLGRVRVTGTLAVYKQDATMLAKYLAQTNTNIAVTLGGASSQKYAFTLPKVRFTQAQAPASGSNAVLETFNFSAMYDPTDSTMKIIGTD